MRKARVKVIAISLPKNRVLKCGAEVTENNLPAGRFDELLKGGYIELTGENEEAATPLDHEEVVITTTPEEIKEQGIIESEARKAAEEVNAPPVETNTEEITESMDDTTRKEIMAELDYEGIKYNKNMTKAELYELWESKTKN